MTVGQKSLELAQKQPDTRDPIELQRKMQEDYVKNVVECLERGKKSITGSFYVVVTIKKERLMSNVIRNYFFPRKSCPTPEWDQSVYRYDVKKDDIEFLWIIPSKDTCALFKENILEIAQEERELLNYILMFEDGTLFKLAKRLNNEKDDSIILDKD